LKEDLNKTPQENSPDQITQKGDTSILKKDVSIVSVEANSKEITYI